MPTPEIDDEHACSDTASVWPLLLATGCRDLRAALRQIEESSEPIEISIRTL